MPRPRPFIIHRVEHTLTNLFVRAILYITDGLLITGASFLAPIFAIFVEQIGGGVIEAGTAVTIYSLTAGIGIFVFSRMEDKIRDFRHFVVIGYLVASLGYLIYLFAHNITILFIAQFVLGLGTAIRIPAYDVLLSQSAPGHLAVAWGNWNSLAFLATAVGAFVGALIASIFGFQTLLIILFFLTVAALSISLVLLRKHHHKDFLPQTKQLLEEKN